jgi:hypothetical protein
VNGRKRHIAVDALGLLLAVVITAASVQYLDSAAAHGLSALEAVTAALTANPGCRCPPSEPADHAHPEWTHE